MSEFKEKQARYINPTDFEWNCVMDTAKEEAALEKAEEIARKMIQENEPIEKIIRYTDLPITEIDKLINELKNKTL